MTYSWGMTRFVILVGPWAVKIARFRFYWIFKRLIRHSRDGDLKAKVTLQYRYPRLPLQNIFAGVLANRTEWRVWQTTKHPSMMPTRFTFLYLINLEVRGEYLPSKEDLDRLHPFPDYAVKQPELIEDMGKPANFIWHQGVIRITDYGHPRSQEFFSALLKH